jgi:hypothetical protein
MDEAQQAVFQQGTDVGKLAEQLFPGGVDARPKDSFSYQQSVADTAKFIAKGHEVVYEAAFQYEGLLCAVDILVKQNDQWYAYEVKSTTSVKPQHIPDAAFQYYVITRAGLELADFSIIHLNNQYIRKGDLNIQELFAVSSVLEDILLEQDFIHEQGENLKAMLQNKNEMPQVEVGNHCDKPYPCDFQGFCSAEYETEEDEPEEEYIDKDYVESFLSAIEYPIYHVDFESWSTAVPQHDGHWPFRQVCFQYSVHVERKQYADPEHSEYLAEGTHCSSLEFLESLLKVLGEKGTILVYNKTFEATRLKELMQEHPQYEKAVQDVLDRMIDLMQPFRKHVRLPAMQGSYSIKKVLPAMVPELSYDELPIGSGGVASAAFYHLKDTIDSNDVERTRKALLEYCKMDTYAMVRLLGVLRGINVINEN